MRVLVVHNLYKQRGGEDQCYLDLIKILRDNDHDVASFTADNSTISATRAFGVASGTIWNRSAAKALTSRLNSFQPDLAHIINTFPLLSPSVAHAAHNYGIPVVFEIQNYRLFCAAGSLLRSNEVCTMCVDRGIPWPAIWHRCYRNSVAATTPLAANIAIHRWLGTWKKNCDFFLCPSKVMRDHLIQFGLPASRIRVKPNFLHYDPGAGTGRGGYVIFVGRLSVEKGLDVMLDAWQQDRSLPNLKIIGDGPAMEHVTSRSSGDPRIEVLGRMSIENLLDYVGNARFLIMPSIWLEPFGRTTIEAFAKATPVIGSMIGATAEIIEPGVDGFLFPPGNSRALTECIHLGYSLSETEDQRMRQNARKKFLDQYTSSANWKILRGIYDELVGIGSANHHLRGPRD